MIQSDAVSTAGILFDFRISQLEESSFASYQVHFGKELIDSFARSTGDFNPIHVDESYIARTEFQDRVVHGLLLASYFSPLVGMYLPGARALILETHFEFVNPVSVGTTVTYSGVIREVVRNMGTFKLKVLAYAGDSVFVRGHIWVRVRETRDE